jgi:energy-coupling factor transporter ATP-binding protein EcfA2
MTWFNQLKFKENPLDIRPSTILIGLREEEDRLKNHIQKGEVCFINGLTGSGKTSLLKKTQNVMKNHEFIYLDAHDLPKNFNIEDELKSKKSFFDKITFKEYPKKSPVLIIDEFQETDRNLVLKIRSKWENPINKRIQSIIFAQISHHLHNVTDSFKERIGNRTITLQPLDAENLKRMFNERLRLKKINYGERLTDDALNLLIYTSGGNPRRFLEQADLVFDFHFHKFKDINPILKEDYRINHYAVREILELSNINCEGFKSDESELKKKKTADTFDTYFTPVEKKLLAFLINKGPSTYSQIALGIKVKKNNVKKVINTLKKKNGVKLEGRTDQGYLWDASPHTKRMTVNV